MNHQKNKNVVCLMGPTACGKTDLAINMVQKGGYEIISVDSAMIYCDMDIGTAKPSAEELRQAPHRLINIRDPKESYSVGDFCRDVVVEIEDIFSRGNTPLLVGGSMMYFYQLQQGCSNLPSADPNIREQIAVEAKQSGWPEMHAKLKAIDEVTAKQLHPNDAQRISRALEIFYQTGKALSQWHLEQTSQAPRYTYEHLILGTEDRHIIHQRIEQRFDLMLKMGFIEEVEALYKRGDLHPDLPSIRSVGYRQAWNYIAGHWDKETMREKVIIATRQLCKRQLTWLRRWNDANR